MRILIVDDSYLERKELKSLLEKQGDCEMAPCGEMVQGMLDAGAHPFATRRSQIMLL